MEIFVGGKFIRTEKELIVKNPYNGNFIATTWLGGLPEFEIAVSAALAARLPMHELPSYKRYEVLMHIRNRLAERREEFGNILMQESGKPLRYALAEVDRAIQTFTIAAEESKRLPREYISLDWTPSGEKKDGIVKYFPVGIVAAISPFNFPLNLAVHKISPAIAAGCPIIVKPSSTTPLSTLLLATIIAETELPVGSVSIMPMDRSVGNKLVTDPRIALLTFTGSPDVGWKMKNEAGKKKVVLELGGNAGVIITESANLESAVTKCVTGAFSYSGQVCIHTQRIFVHKSRFADFIRSFSELTEKLTIGDPSKPETDFSCMIDEANAVRVEKWVAEALKDGAELICGGKREGSYVAPTVLTNTRAGMKLCSEEVFGPVVTIDAYDDFDEAINRINETRFGLQAGVFTNNIDAMDRAFNRIEVGGVIINDVPNFRADHMPYGGVKDSGFGREGVKYAMLDMLEPRIMVK